jgi:hypothetical protein
MAKNKRFRDFRDFRLAWTISAILPLPSGWYGTQHMPLFAQFDETSSSEIELWYGHRVAKVAFINDGLRCHPNNHQQNEVYIYIYIYIAVDRQSANKPSNNRHDLQLSGSPLRCDAMVCLILVLNRSQRW